MCRSWFLWIGLIGLCIVGAAVRCPENSCRAQPQPAEVIGPPMKDVAGPPRPEAPNQGKRHQTVTKNVMTVVTAPKAPPAPVFETKVAGYGETDEDASEDAVKEACHKVAEFLRTTYGETDYAPTPEDLKVKHIVGTPEFETAHFPVTGDLRKAFVDVKVNGDQVKDFRESARKVRVNGRMKIAVMVLAGFVALVLVGGGYLRMEEATKGYYTTLLRVVALGVIGIVAASMLMGFLSGQR